MSNIFYTYLYRDPSRNNEPMLEKVKVSVFWYHLRSIFHRHPFIRRLRKMRRNGIEPIIEFLCKDVDEEFAFLVEMGAIYLYGRKNLGKGTLLNLTVVSSTRDKYTYPGDVRTAATLASYEGSACSNGIANVNI